MRHTEYLKSPKKWQSLKPDADFRSDSSYRLLLTFWQYIPGLGDSDWTMFAIVLAAGLLLATTRWIDRQQTLSIWQIVTPTSSAVQPPYLYLTEDTSNAYSKMRLHLVLNLYIPTDIFLCTYYILAGITPVKAPLIRSAPCTTTCWRGFTTWSSRSQATHSVCVV